MFFNEDPKTRVPGRNEAAGLRALTQALLRFRMQAPDTVKVQTKREARGSGRPESESRLRCPSSHAALGRCHVTPPSLDFLVRATGISTVPASTGRCEDAVGDAESSAQGQPLGKGACRAERRPPQIHVRPDPARDLIWNNGLCR